MKAAKAVVLCNGTPPEKELLESEVSGDCTVLCADGAARWAMDCGVKIDVLVGDMDSLDERSLERIERSGVQIVRLNHEKDETDTQIAVDLAISRGAKKLTLLGASGSRLDHTLGNVQLLVRCRKAGVEAKLMDAHNTVMVTDGRIECSGKQGDLLSIVPLGEHVRATTFGLYYPLHEYEFELGTPLGISNVFTAQEAAVEISGGFAAIILARD